MMFTRIITLFYKELRFSYNLLDNDNCLIYK